VKGDVRHTGAKVDRAQRVLGFAARVPLEEGLDRMVRWMVERISG